MGPTGAAARIWRALAIAVTGLIFLWHARETYLRFSLGTHESEPLPFTTNDHPLHYYYSQITADFFARRGAFWGYDPHFMAGYAKSMIFPTGCTLPELVAIVFGRGSVMAFRYFVASTMFLPPFMLAAGAWLVARRGGAFMLSFCLGVFWVWCSWPYRYVTWGMAPFILSISASVLAGSLLADWLAGGSWFSLVGGSALATFATISHPCSPVVLALMLGPAYAASARHMNWRSHATAWSVPVIVIALWSPWWLPAWRLRDTFGSTETGFVNENVGGRLIELVKARAPEETGLLLAAPAAVVGLWGVGRARYVALVAGAAEFFLVTYFGGALETSWKLQPGRYTQPLYATLVVIIGAGWSRLASKLADPAWRRQHVKALRALGCCSFASVVLVGFKVFGHAYFEPRQTLNIQLPADVQNLIAHLRTLVDSSGRVLFEDHGDLDLEPIDPFGGTSPSALLPLLVPGQYIGGPYLKTHLKTNFTQVGDGKFFGRDLAKQRIDVETFERYAELYNIRWVVLRAAPVTVRELLNRGAPADLAVYWSAPLWRFARVHPELFRPIGDFGLIRVYELNRTTNWAVVGHADVIATLDRLTVTNARPDASGRLVLSYHWLNTLQSSVPIRPVMMVDDPVPFIEIVNPPEQFVIENRP